MEKSASSNQNSSHKKNENVGGENVIIITEDDIIEPTEPLEKIPRTRFGNVNRWDTEKVC